MFKSITLEGLSPSQHLDTVGVTETLHQKYESWKMDLEIYITISGSAMVNKMTCITTNGEIWRNFTGQEKTEKEATSPGTSKKDVY